MKRHELSPDGRILVLNESSEISIWRFPEGTRVGKVTMTQNGCQESIGGMAVHFGKGMIACWNGASLPGKRWLQLVEIRDGSTVASLAVEKSVEQAVFDQTGNYLIGGLGAHTGGPHPGVAIWSIPQLSEVTKLYGHKQDVSCIAVSPSNHWLATAGFYTTEVCVWDLTSRSLAAKLELPGGNFKTLRWSSDEKGLFAALFDKAAFWKVDTGFQGPLLLKGIEGSAFAGDFVMFARTNYPDYEVEMWSLTALEKVVEPFAVGRALPWLLSPHGQFVFTETRAERGAGRNALWDIRTGTELIADVAGWILDFCPSGESYLVRTKETIQAASCPDEQERERLGALASKRRAEEMERKDVEIRKREEEQREREATERKRAEEQRRREEAERQRLEEAKRKRAEEDRRRNEKKAREEDARRAKLVAQRKMDRLCAMCGKPLGLIDRFFKRDHHAGCKEFVG